MPNWYDETFCNLDHSGELCTQVLVFKKHFSFSTKFTKVIRSIDVVSMAYRFSWAL